MKTEFFAWPGILVAAIIAAAFSFTGCSENTSQKDVGKAQQQLDKTHADTQDVMQKGQRDVAAAQRDDRNYTVNKPVTPEDATAANQNIADAQHKANENVADAKEKEREAASNLKTTEQKYQATQARDAFVNQADQRLADYDKRIDELNQQASQADAAAKETLNRQIDTVKGQRDRAKTALNGLKSADLAHWQSHQDNVRMAFQELDNTFKNVR